MWKIDFSFSQHFTQVWAQKPLIFFMSLKKQTLLMLEHKNRDCFSMQFCQQNLSPDCGIAPNELCDVLNRLTLFKQSSHGFFSEESWKKISLPFFSKNGEREGDLTWVYVQSRKMF